MLQREMLQHQADIFMHDNAPCHRANRVSRFFLEENIQVFDQLVRKQSRCQPH